MTYYYNEQTGQSQWEPPPGAAAGAGAAGYGGGQFAAAGTWQVCNAAGTCFVVRPGEVTTRLSCCAADLPPPPTPRPTREREGPPRTT